MQRKHTFLSFTSFLTLGVILLGMLGVALFIQVWHTAHASGSLPTGLHVVGNHIEDGNGTVIVSHGVDRMGTEYQCTKTGTTNFDGPVDQASVNAILAWDVNIVRVPLNEDCWLGLNGFPVNGTTSAQYQTDIKNWVSLLNQNNIVVILELHWNAPGSQLATGQEPMPDLDHAPAFWTSVANTFKNNSSLIFDLYNEPYTTSWSCWLNGSTAANASPCTDVSFAVAGMQNLVNTVRATGASNILMLGGLAYSNDLSGWLANKPSDSDHNLVASAHIYNFNSCNDTSCWNAEVAPVNAQVPVLVGEIGENDCASGFINTLMGWLDGQNIGYLGWTWTATGNCGGTPALISDYNGTPTNYGQGYKTHLLSLGHATHVTDPLNDYTYVYAHSANLTFDTINTQYFNGDTSRLTRTATSAEWVIWQMAGMAEFNADTYFWTGQSGVSDFQFFASPNNNTYAQLSPQVNNLGGNWTHIQYTLSLPAGTSYLKMVFPTNATNTWNPQIAQVSYSSGASVIDPLNDYTYVYAHSGNLTFDNSNAQYFNGDTSRLTRTATDAEWVIWQLSGMTEFQADTYFWPYQSGVNNFQFYASPDNTTYMPISPQINNLGGSWTQIQYTLSLPAGTNYLKIVFPTNASNAWDPQISQVSYTGV